jgi:hypothetical protein
MQSFVISALVLCSGSIDALADDQFEQGFTARQEPAYQIGVRLGYRIDNLQDNDYSTIAGGRFMYFASDHLALTLGGLYSNHTEPNDRVSFRSLTWESSLRLYVPRKQITPFFEAGFCSTRYWGINRGRRYTDFRPGLRLGFGLSVLLGGDHSLDIGINQVFNHITQYAVPGSFASVAPCGPGVDCDFVAPVPGEAYNESTVELTYRFGL